MTLQNLSQRNCPSGMNYNTITVRVTINKSYSCEVLGLRGIPKKLPVTTEILDFSFNILPSLDNSTFSELKSLLYLDLTRCQINRVYNGAFHSNKWLKTIILTGNLILFLSDTAFAELVLTQMGIASISFIPMTNLHSLDTLILGSNHISSLHLPPSFPTLDLKYLDFQMNNIRAITAEDVHSLQKTRNITLIFKDGDITYIEPGAFQSHFYSFGGCCDIPEVLAGIQNPTVQTLWLGTFHGVARETQISLNVLRGLCNVSVKDLTLQLRCFRNLNADTLQCLTRLQKLDVTQTHISTLLPSISGMSSLAELILNANSFKHFCNISSAAFSSLTHLYIKGNLRVLQLGSGCLEKLAKLQHLNFSKSHIESSDCYKEALSGWSHLWFPTLSHNVKLHLQDVLIKDGANLELLDLAFTPLHINTSQGLFRNLHLLQVLNLPSLLINTSIKHVFQGLENLTVLDLSQNKFESGIIPKDKLFQQLSLEVLILSSCELTGIDGQAFHSLKKLQHVDLSHNKITVFSTDAFSDLKSISLKFAHNRIHTVPHEELASLAGCCVINLSSPMDCTCSSFVLITYKQKMDKTENPEGTRCSDPKLVSAGTQLTTISLSYGINTAGIIAVALAAIFIWGAHCFKQNYEQI
ncbi:LOW QUALITY PROTEIN: CD180 antigen [Phaethornis superciliosus]